MCTPFRVRTIGAPTLAVLCMPDCGRALTRPEGAGAREIPGAVRPAAAGAETPAPPRCWAVANAGSANIVMTITENRVVAEPLLMTREPFVSLLRKMRLGLPWFHHPMVLGLFIVVVCYPSVHDPLRR